MADIEATHPDAGARATRGIALWIVITLVLPAVTLAGLYFFELASLDGHRQPAGDRWTLCASVLLVLAACVAALRLLAAESRPMAAAIARSDRA